MDGKVRTLFSTSFLVLTACTPRVVALFPASPLWRDDPIRLFLGGFDLTPTFRDINKFSTSHYALLCLRPHRPLVSLTLRLTPRLLPAAVFCALTVIVRMPEN
ncbi:hypothetical protein B0H19DRAFT_97433 [Mycena capillaripes]|nr:hypothetical protein B0H19DRAFT_97433 [Mycena capillaripes]